LDQFHQINGAKAQAFGALQISPTFVLKFHNIILVVTIQPFRLQHLDKLTQNASGVEKLKNASQQHLVQNMPSDSPSKVWSTLLIHTTRVATNCNAV